MATGTASSGAGAGPAGVATTRTAYEAIRDDIGAGRVGAGEWLRESSVAASLGLSRTPVREALRMLASEGVVELVHNRGARVVRWSAQDVDEVYRLRALLEGEGAAWAARRATPADVARMVALEDEFERAVAGGAAPATAAVCNDALHAAVVAASGVVRLRALLDVMASGPLVARAMARYTPDDLARSQLQHRDVITAIGSGDADLAAAAMRSHILAARYAARHALEAVPDAPGDAPGEGLDGAAAQEHAGPP